MLLQTRVEARAPKLAGQGRRKSNFYWILAISTHNLCYTRQGQWKIPCCKSWPVGREGN